MAPHTLRVFTPDTDQSFSPGPLTVAQVIAWYIASARTPDSSVQGQHERERVLGLFSAEYGILLVKAARPAHLLAFINAQKGVRAAWTRRRWKATCSRPFSYALEVGLIEANPFQSLRMPTGAEGRDWEPWEYQAVLRHAPAHVRRFLVFIRYSGMRPGEIRNLEWDHVDLIERQLILKNHKTFRITKRARHVPINAVMLSLLTWLKARRPAGTKFVFLNAWGRQWTCRNLVDRLDAIRNRAGVGKDVKMHGGRHTFATGAVVNGVDPATLAELLGHSNIATTQRYLHLAKKKPHLASAMEQAVKRR